eukprot:3234901-Alexandrium_andersonii.AAC.1
MAPKAALTIVANPTGLPTNCAKAEIAASARTHASTCLPQPAGPRIKVYPGAFGGSARVGGSVVRQLS